ncbi:hypothetical protein BDV06DRAFT_202554 [Aspergillus oleicola]
MAYSPRIGTLNGLLAAIWSQCQDTNFCLRLPFTASQQKLGTRCPREVTYDHCAIPCSCFTIQSNNSSKAGAGVTVSLLRTL